MLYIFRILGVLGIQRFQFCDKIFISVVNWGLRPSVGEKAFEEIRES